MEFRRKPWGWYLTIWEQRYFKIKFLFFKKGKAISLQRHFKRQEVWLYIMGSGTMDNYICHSSSVSSQKRAGDYSSVSMRNWHKFTADKRTLVLEIQTGICEEEDIERFQ